MEIFSNMLIYFVIIPVITLAGLALTKNKGIDAIRAVAVTGATALVALAIYLVIYFLHARATGDTSDMILQTSVTWYEPLNIKLALGVDGVSVVMILLSAFIVFAGVFASWKMDPLPKQFFLWFFLLSTGVFGFFISVDLFTMFMFYEVALIPMYLLIGVWGSGNKTYSAMKLTLMLMGGSAFLMLGIIGIYFHSAPEGQPLTMNILEIAQNDAIPHQWQYYLFPLTFVGFGVLGAMFPFHTWSPDGHASAPTAVSMLHAGVLMKLGGYGCFRIAIFLMPFAAQQLGWIFLTLTGISIVYGAFSACVQTDLKYINAYSSVSHCGMVLFAILMFNKTAMTGAVLQDVQQDCNDWCCAADALTRLDDSLVLRPHRYDLRPYTHPRYPRDGWLDAHHALSGRWICNCRFRFAGSARFEWFCCRDDYLRWIVRASGYVPSSAHHCSNNINSYHSSLHPACGW